MFACLPPTVSHAALTSSFVCFFVCLFVLYQLALEGLRQTGGTAQTKRKVIAKTNQYKGKHC